MNLVGKIFTLLIFVMSLVFASFTLMVYSTHKIWREEVYRKDPARPGFIQQLDELNLKLKERNDAYDDLQLQYSTLEQKTKQRVTEVEQEKKTLEELNAALKQQNTDLEKTAREAAEAMKDIQLAQKNYREELGPLRADRDKAVRVQHDHLKQIVKLQDEANASKAEVSRLGTFNRDLGEQINSLHKVLAYHGWTEHTPENQSTPPRVEGIILALSEQGDLVTISVGSDDGILKSHELEVFRLGTTPKYLGRIQVIDSQPDRSVARVIPETRKGPFEKFDHVATKLR